MAEQVRDRIPRRDFILVMVATLTALCNFAPLVSVVPLWAAAGGGSGGGVGATTGVMMATTAATQVGMGPVLKRYTLRGIFVGGALIMAVATPFYLLSDQLLPVLVVSGVRGVGFGLLVVSASALVAEIVPSHLLARGLGIHGLATGAPMVAALPGGVWVAQQWSFSPVFVAATVLAVVGAALASRLHAGGRSAEERPGPATGSDLLDPDVERDHTPAGATDLLQTPPRPPRAGFLGSVGPLLQPALAFFSLTMALGSVNTFLPLAVPEATMVSLALVVTPLAMIAGRFGSGVLSGQLQAGRLVLPGTVIGAVGMVGVAFGTAAAVSSWVMVIGAGVFGLGLGIAQNDSLVVIMDLAGPGRRGLASTVWNFAYDAGMGTGAVLFGAVLAGVDYPVAFGLAAVVIALAVPLGRVRTRQD